MRQSPISRLALAACAMLLVAGRGPVSAALHDPRDLPALERDARVHYDANAKGYAEAVARLLPGAMACVEAAQGGLSKDPSSSRPISTTTPTPPPMVLAVRRRAA